MNTAEIIYKKSKLLPEPIAQEVLDFIGYLEHKKLKGSSFPPTDLEHGFGSIGYTGKAKSIEEMDQAIADELKQQWKNR